jgi:hypothetical protein
MNACLAFKLGEKKKNKPTVPPLKTTSANILVYFLLPFLMNFKIYLYLVVLDFV